MGLLDGTTNNIIVDTVLTDTGRQYLARNNGSFSIAKFALGDDEVNYTIIQKYGRTVGKEKIEKNTPIFEAITNKNYAQKYKLISISNPNLIRLPNLSLSGDSNVNSVSSTVTLGRNTAKSSNISVEQTITNENVIDVELRDQTFIVEMNNLFLTVQGASPTDVDGQQSATYLLARAATETSQHGSILQFTISVRSITDAQFTVFGTASNKSVITTYVRVTGASSGAVKEFRVNISKTL
jgi:hypothetical protein